ncbi:MAG: triphosphoribosyl-dephospho-CoA synthase CitG [Lactovum sp.]
MQNKNINAALSSLLYELVLYPKPGLVDPVSSGAHSDMDVFTFIESSISLRQYFEELIEISSNFYGENYQELFEKIRKKGIKAEKAMFDATSNVNTHKGAIFSLGILLTAVSYIEKRYPVFESIEKKEEVLRTIIKSMLYELVEKDFKNLTKENAQTIGEQHFLLYGLTGIRGEAAQAFPIVFEIALPYLRKTKGTKRERLLDTLMIISANLEDSNLIKRAGDIQILKEMKAYVEQYFKATDKIQFLKDLDSKFIERNLSLGGSADLLILTIFLAIIEGTL